MIKKTIKYLTGESYNSSIEERLFLSAVIIGMVLGIIGTITNIFLMEGLIPIMAPAFSTLVLGIFYYFVRVKKLFDKLAFPIIITSFVALAFIWIINAGMDGSNDIIFLIALMLGLILVDNKKKIYVLVLFIAIKTILYFVQLVYPELINGFPSEYDRWMDIFSTSIYTPVLVYLIISFLYRNYTSERKKVEDGKKILEEMNAKLNESNQTKDLFLSIISHDLKSPFNAIIGFSDLLVNGAEKYDKEKIHSLSVNINHVAHETYFLLENLLSWTRLQQGGLNPRFESNQLYKLVNDVGILYKEVAKNKQITLNILIPENLYVFCDEEMTKTIIRNLVANAIKYTKAGGKITCSAQFFKGMVEICIADTGIGIANEKISEFFYTDFNGTTKGTANETGTGLGLRLCKHFVELQGGNIGVESRVDEGSKFYFTLPKCENRETEKLTISQLT